MTLELHCLAWSIVLGLAHILIAGNARTKELGFKWNMGARDEKTQDLNPLTGRLLRAQSNFFETFPLFASAVLIVAVSHAYSVYSYWGCLIYLIARIIYLPIYALGVPVMRTIIWLCSIIGLLMVLIPSIT
ncbi:MAG: MAPEG family protein [Bdellovibrio sp.]|nr:MAPEG family protein [Methylotenera sp.]